MSNRMKETRELIEQIEAAGGVVRHARRSGHWKVYIGGRLVTTLSKSSSDVKSNLAVRSRLRREGLAI